MNPFRPTRVFLFGFLFLCLCHESQAQMKINFDFSNCEETIAFLKKERVSESELEGMVSSAGVRSIARKLGVKDSVSRQALLKIRSGGKLVGKENNFQYGFIQDNLNRLDSFVRVIKLHQQQILDSIRFMEALVPPGKKMEVTIRFLLGGHSAGFTFGEADVFYLGVHQYKMDFMGILNTCQHELFHNMQSLYQDKSEILKKLESAKETPSLYFVYLASNIFTEGTAEYVADFDRYKPSPFITHTKDHYASNNFRRAENFYVIERLLLDAYRQPEKMDPDMSYTVLFDWNWNNIGYDAGKFMMKALTKEYGPDAIRKYLAAPSIVFLQDFVKLSRKDKGVSPYAFSDEFVEVVDIVAKKVVEK